MTTSIATLSNIAFDAKIDMNDVVSAFVTRYETALYDRKEALSAEIKALKQSIKDIEQRLIDSVNKDEYAVTLPLHKIRVANVQVDVKWVAEYNSNNANTIAVSMTVYMANSSYGQSNTIYLPIDQATVGEKNVIDEVLKVKESELLDVFGLIKTIARKERQIRGHIAEQKMQQAGMEDLLQDPTLKQLVSM